MQPVSVARAAALAAVGTGAACIVATFVGLQRGEVVGLTIRTLLVLAVMLVVVSRGARRRGAHDFPGPEVTGVLLAWALNPFSWIGRSYVGQWWIDEPGLVSAAVDAVGWAVSALLVGLLVRRVLVAAQHGG